MTQSVSRRRCLRTALLMSHAYRAQRMEDRARHEERETHNRMGQQISARSCGRAILSEVTARDRAPASTSSVSAEPVAPGHRATGTDMQGQTGCGASPRWDEGS